MRAITSQRARKAWGDQIIPVESRRSFLPGRGGEEQNGVWQAEKKLAAMLQPSIAGIVVCRLRDGVIVEVNKRWLAMFGVRRAEVIGRVPASWAWKHLEEWRRMVRDLKRCRVCADREIHFRKANGEDFLALTSAQLTELNGERVIISSLVDMTEHQRLEVALQELTTAFEERVARRTAALRESEERFRALATASSDVIYRMSPDWAEMRELQGQRFLPDTKKPSRTWLQKYIHPEDQTHVLAVIRRAIRTKRVFELEHRVLRLDGSIGWSFSRAIPVLDARGRIVEWLGMAKDVTKAKQAEETLQANLAAMTKLRELGMMFVRNGELQAGLAAIVTTAIAIAGADFGDLQLCEPGSGELKVVAQRGFPKRWSKFWGRLARGKGECGMALLRGQRIIVEDVARSKIFAGKVALKIRRKTGTRALQATPLISRSGKVLGVCSTYSRFPHRPDERTLALLDLLALQAADLIERNQAEEALRESEHRFRQVVESLPQLVWTCAAGGPCDYLSPQWVRYTGKAEAEQLGYGWLQQLHPDDRGRVRTRWRETTDHGGNFECEYRIRRHDGVYRWFRTLAVPLCDEAGRVVKWFGSNTDIDDIKQAEAQRAQALAEFNTTVSCMTDGLMVFKPDGDLSYMNPAAKRLLGCPPQTRERSLASWVKRIVVTKEDGTAFHPKDSLTLGALRGDSVPPAVLSLRLPGGRAVWILSSAAVMRTANGKCLGAVTVFADITERKKVEAALRESEVRFRTIFNAAGDGMFLIDLHFSRFHLANQSCLDMLGYTVHEFLNLRIEDLHRKQDLPFIRAEIAKLRCGGCPERAEIPFRRKDGRFILVEVSPTAVRLGGRDYALVVLRDVTNSRQIERERALLAAIVESSSDAIYALDAKGIFTAWAAGAERLYGYSAAEAVGKPISLIVPRDRRAEIPILLKKLKRCEVISGFESIRVCKNGKRIPVSVTISPMRDAAGQIVGWSGISRDISERKRLEMQLLEAGEREQHRLGHDLHDGLAQELHGLCYLAKLLEKELKRELPARAPEARRLANVLGEAFHLTRSLAHGLQPVSPVPEGLMLSLRKLTQRTRDLYGVDCRFECRRPVLIHLHNAATHLYRIAQEAVNNAMRHGHPKQIRIQLAGTPRKIILGIRDDGVGLRRRKVGQRGMGLHIMQYRAEAIRGSLVVQKHREGGTEVVCTVERGSLLEPEEQHHEGNASG